MESLSQAEILFGENIIKLKDGKDRTKKELSLPQQDFEEKLEKIDKFKSELSNKDVTNIKKKLKRKDITLKSQTELLKQNEELIDLLEFELEKD